MKPDVQMADEGRVSERMLYTFLINYLDKIGFEAIQNPNVKLLGKRYEPDIIADYKNFSAIIEVEVGKETKLIEGMTQVYNHLMSMKKKNSLVILYPSDIRKPYVNQKQVENLVFNTEITALILTELGSKKFTGRIDDLFKEILRMIKSQSQATDIYFAIDVIKESIETISEVLRQYEPRLKDAIDSVVGRFDLFSSLGDLGGEKVKSAVINLMSYLLVNQILFYHIYSQKTGRIDSLNDNIRNVTDILKDFKKIREINYASIYSIEIAPKLPNDEKIVRSIQNIIKAIKIIKPENIKHDLMGRLFHQLLPYDTRKVLATFYTNPIASEILAGLSIDRWDEEVTDIACGSGTLLVSDYRIKSELYEQTEGKLVDGVVGKIHKRFVENDLTGIDIMPFASHLTAVNLSSQHIEVTTNKLRVGVMDSLDLQENLEVLPFSKTIQGTISDFQLGQKSLDRFTNKKLVDKKGAVGAEDVGEKFVIKKADVITMNPPFTDREKMPEDFRNKLNAKIENESKRNKIKRLIDKCGKQVNLWGYFLAVADDLVKQNGKIGAVVPINILRGAATQSIRDFILGGYHLRYIIKSTKDWGFSENSSFRDILLIMEKRQPHPEELTSMVLIKKSLKELSIEDADRIVRAIRSVPVGKRYIDDDLSVSWVTYKELMDNRNNLMPLVGFTSVESRLLLNDFSHLVKERSNQKLYKLDEEQIREGFHASPSGLSQLVFVTRQSDPSRVERSFLILEKEDKNGIVVRIKNTDFRFQIDANNLMPALRTITGVDTIDITENQDYLILDKFKGSNRILSMSKWKGKFDWNVVSKKMIGKETHLAIPHRFRLFSSNTKLLAVYSDKKFVTPHSFTIFLTKDKEKCKILSLFLNSIVYMTQLYSLKKETTEAFTEIMKKDLMLMDMLNVDKLSKKEKNGLLRLFEKVKRLGEKSLIDQIKTEDSKRLELDKSILRILGLSEMEIDKWLPKLYNAILKESRATEGTSH